MSFADGEKRRAISAARLTESTVDGEALSALRALNRFAVKRGTTLAAIVEQGLSRPVEAVPDLDPFAQASWPRPMRRPGEVLLPKPWQKDAILLLRFPALTLSESERDFLLSMRERRQEPSRKQKEWLGLLLSKHRRAAA